MPAAFYEGVLGADGQQCLESGIRALQMALGHGVEFVQWSERHNEQSPGGVVGALKARKAERGAAQRFWRGVERLEQSRDSLKSQCRRAGMRDKNSTAGQQS